MTVISPRGVSLGVCESELTFLRRAILEVSLECSTELMCKLSLFLSIRTCFMVVYAFIIERAWGESDVFSLPASYAFWVFYVEIQVSFFCNSGFRDQYERIFIKQAYAIIHFSICKVPLDQIHSTATTACFIIWLIDMTGSFAWKTKL